MSAPTPGSVQDTTTFGGQQSSSSFGEYHNSHQECPDVTPTPTAHDRSQEESKQGGDVSMEESTQR